MQLIPRCGQHLGYHNNNSRANNNNTFFFQHPTHRTKILTLISNQSLKRAVNRQPDVRAKKVPRTPYDEKQSLSLLLVLRCLMFCVFKGYKESPGMDNILATTTITAKPTTTTLSFFSTPPTGKIAINFESVAHARGKPPTRFQRQKGSTDSLR